ncbi:hypothetical protein Cs7R123_05510 [Catellatospora sp. TT07R-123]|nr:hypothetical protein Cs7R123_05510 [Catellatospora sp. TT07R-123]
MTPMQRWFIETHPDPRRLTQSLTVELAPPVDTRAIAAAVRTVVARHDALRLQFTRTDRGWRQRVTDARPHLARLPGRQLPDALDALRQSIDLGRPPLLTAALLDPAALDPAAPGAAPGGPGQARAARLLLVVHGLAIDAASWSILLADLGNAYRAARDGRAPDRRPAPTSFARWARALAEHTAAGGSDRERSHWYAATPSTADAAATHRRTHPHDRDGGEITVGLDAGYTDRLLRHAHAAYRTRVEDLLICALAHTVARRTGRAQVHLDVAGTGRDTTVGGVDPAGAVGCFTTLFPVRLEVPGGAPWRELVPSVKERLRAGPGPGLAHGALRQVPAAPTLFTYLGRWNPPRDPDLRAAEQGPVTDRPRGHDLEVTAAIRGGRLEVTWAYAGDDEPAAHAEARAFIAALSAIIEHCDLPDAGRCTPSDFPLSGLDQAALDRVTGNGRHVEDIYPLTPTQQGMLFHTLLDPDAGLYVERVVCTIPAVPQPLLLGQAWQDVVDRTPALRTAVAHGGLTHPVQVVHSAVRLPVSYHPWPGERHLDLPGPPLMRVNIATVDTDTVEVTWDLHHLVLDGWSMRQVIADVLARHRLRAGQTAPAAPARRPFRRHLEWLSRQDHDAALRFWQHALAGAALPTPLPYRPERRERPHARGRAHTTSDLAGESARLRAFAGGSGLTVSTVVQGAWALVLAQHSGRGDVTFGATVSGRPDIEGADAIIGMFATTVPVRVRLRPDQPVTAWLADLQAANLAAQPFHHAPLNRIHAAAGLPAGGSLFDSIVVFENYPPAGEADLSSLRAIEVTHYPLALVVVGGAQLSLRLLYDPDLFTAATIDAIMHQLRRMLAQLAAEPHRDLGRLLPATTVQPSAPVSYAAEVPTGGSPPAAAVAAVEQRLRQIWTQVLAVPRSGPDDDFFALGGDSLQALQVLTRVLDAFGVDLPLRALFDHPTIAGLAIRVCAAVAAADGDRIEATAGSGPLPQSSAQRRLWYSHLVAPDSAQYHTGLALRLTGALDLDRLHRTLHSLIDRHEALRTVFGPGPVQRILPAQPVDLPQTDLTEVDADTREHALRHQLRAAMRAPFDLGLRPPVRAQLIRLGTEEHVLHLVLHHLSCDGWSMAVLTEELIGGYTADGSTGWPARPPVRYADYAAWQQRRLTGSALSGALAYWRRQLADLRPAHLPGDRPTPSAPTRRAATADLAFPAPLVAALRRAARDADATLFMAVTAVTQLLLGRRTGRRDVAVGTVTAGRDRVELERVVGCFVETVVLRSSIDERLSFVDFLARVRDTVLAASAQPAPFELVVRATRPPRRDGGTPFVSVLVVLQQRAPVTAPWAEEIPVPVTESPFELILEFRQTPDGLALAVTYLTDLFSADLIRRFGEDLLELAATVTAAPHRALGHLAVLGDGERDEPRDGPREDEAAARPGIPPRTPAERLVARYWTDLLLEPTFGVHDKFFEAGGSSLALLELRDRLEPLCGGELPMAALLRHQTVEAMARLIEAPPPASDGQAGDVHL